MRLQILLGCAVLLISATSGTVTAQETANTGTDDVSMMGQPQMKENMSLEAKEFSAPSEPDVHKKPKPRIREVSAIGDWDVIVLDNGKEFEGLIVRGRRDTIQFVVVPTSGKVYKVGIPRDRIKRIEKLEPEKRARIRSEIDARLSKQQEAARQSLVEYKKFQYDEYQLDLQRRAEVEREARRQAAIAAQQAREDAETLARIEAERAWADYLRTITWRRRWRR